MQKKSINLHLPGEVEGGVGGAHVRAVVGVDENDAFFPGQ
jgi:hypothetical protein